VIRRLCAWAAACVVVLSLAAPAAAEPSSPTGTAGDPTAEPATPDGAAEVTRPDPGAPSLRSPRVLVFGDSISATVRYSAQGSVQRPRAWWAHVAEAAGMPASEVMLSAEGGSGLLARGFGADGRLCSGTTFGDRLGDLVVARPDVVFVEVGRNDIRACDGPVRRVSSAAERRATASRYFSALAQVADRLGLDRASVYVLTPWGSAFSSGQVATATLYEAEATRRGFSWVAVPALVRAQTTDATHPNAAGAKAIATAVLRGSDAVAAIASRGTVHVRVPARATVVCAGPAQCRAQGIRSARAARHRIWGLAAGTAGHAVAQRLTARRPVAPVLTASTPRAWREAARTEGAAELRAHARVGDVAWWHTAPAGGGTGHVGVVERVAADNSWVVVSERTARGTFRAVRYTGASLPRGYLRFARTDGGPRGLVTGLRARGSAVVVTGRAVDTDAPRRGVRLRVVVRQAGRTFVRTTARPVRTRFTQRFAIPELRRGPARIRVVALDAPRTRGGHRVLLARHVDVR